MNYKAGWGYMMLTNFLPNGGNGTLSWSPGPGFYGRYHLVFVIKDISGDIKRKDILVEIGPKFKLEE